MNCPHLFFLLDCLSDGLAVSLMPCLLTCNTVLHVALPTRGSTSFPWSWRLRLLTLTKHTLVPPTYTNTTHTFNRNNVIIQFPYLNPSEDGCAAVAPDGS